MRLSPVSSRGPTRWSVEFRPAAALGTGTRYTATVTAADLAGNAMAEPVVWSFTTTVPVGQYPATIWTTSAAPAVAAANDSSAIEVGVKFGVDVAGAIAGIRFYKGVGNVGPHTARLWASDGQLLGSVVAGTESAAGWQQVWFAAPIPVQPGQWYIASYHTPTGRYSVTGGGLSSAVVRPPLRAPASAAVGGNGVYRYGAGGFPDGSYADSNYFVDVTLHRPRRTRRHGPDPGGGNGRGVDDDEPRRHVQRADRRGVGAGGTA